MDHFELRSGELCCEEVPLTDIAQGVGTPVYVYSAATLERHYRAFRDAVTTHGIFRNALIAYAVKANSNQAVIATLARLGAGADTVSGGEIHRALAAGVTPDQIVFSGVGKTEAEIALALQRRILQINVESEPELRLVARVAAACGQCAPVAFRVNLDIGAGGHAKITTGGEASKFGVAREDAERLYVVAREHPHLTPLGLACHIGSQITHLEPLSEAFRRLRDLAARIAAGGCRIENLDLGGGLGAPYFLHPDPPAPKALAEMAAQVFDGVKARFIFEPGRVIAANAGALLSRVLLVNQRSDGRQWAVIDAAMNDLVRPALYDAHHEIQPVRPRIGKSVRYDVVGPICESGDTFARGRLLSPLAAGDLLVFKSAGAYGAVMASEYNSRPLAPEALVRGARYWVVRPRPGIAEIIARDRLPPWLNERRRH